MRLLILLLMFSFLGCDHPQENHTTLVEEVIDEDAIEITNEPIVIDKFDFDFDDLDFGLTFQSKDILPKVFSDMNLINESLLKALPPSDLKEWIFSNKDFLGKDDWVQIRPHAKFVKDDITLFSLATYEQTSASNGGYWDYWLLTTFNKTGEISKVTHLGVSGYYTFVESDDEFGEKYFIRNTEVEDLEITFCDVDSIVCQKIRYTLREGHDWRVDQNLKINDSLPIPIVKQVFSAI